MLAADGEAGSKCCDCCAVVPEFGRSECYVVCERGCERERCGVQGKAVKEWRWLWWLYGQMDGGSCGHQLSSLVITAGLHCPCRPRKFLCSAPSKGEHL